MYHEYQANILIICCSISFLSGIFACVAYYLLKQKRTFALKLVMFLCIGDLLAAFAILINNPLLFKQVNPEISNAYNYQFINKTLCQIQGYIKLSGDMSTTCFGCIISLVSYLSVVKGKIQTVKKRQWLFVMLGYIPPFLYATIPLFMKSINPDQYYCDIILNKKDFVNNQQEQWELQLWMIFLPLWCGILFMICINIYIAYYMKRMGIKESKRMMYFPAILIICGFIMSVMFLFSNEIDEEMKNDLFLVQSIIGKLQGFFNALFYGFTPIVRLQIKKSCKRKSQSEDSQYQITQIQRKNRDIGQALLVADLMQSGINKQHQGHHILSDNLDLDSNSYQQQFQQDNISNEKSNQEGSSYDQIIRDD